MRADRIFGLVRQVLALGHFLSARTIPDSFNTDPVGPRVFPYIIAALTAVCAMVMVLRPDANAAWPHGAIGLQLAVALAVVVEYADLIKPLGFVATTTLAAGMLSFQIRPRPLPALLTGFGLGVGLYALFKFVLGLGLQGLPPGAGRLIPITSAMQFAAMEALVISGIATFVGSFIATIGLALLLAQVACQFDPAENFALYLLAFCTLGGLGSTNQAKSAIAAAIALIGVGKQTNMPPFTFGNLHLYDEVNFLVAIVRLVAVVEVFLFIESHGRNSTIRVKLGKATVDWAKLWSTRFTMLRGTVVGFFAGVLRDAGESLGTFLAYMFEKTISRDKETFAKGSPRSVASSEAGTNAAAGEALIPMLTLGGRGQGPRR